MIAALAAKVGVPQTEIVRRAMDLLVRLTEPGLVDLYDQLKAEHDGLPSARAEAYRRGVEEE